MTATFVFVLAGTLAILAVELLDRPSPAVKGGTSPLPIQVR